MKNNFLIITSALLISCSSKNAVKETIEQTPIITTYKYNNQYDKDGRLIKIDIRITQKISNYSELKLEEIKFNYKNNKLIDKRTFSIFEDGKTLSEIESFNDTSSSIIKLNGQDTTMRLLNILDNKGNIVRRISKYNLISSEYSINNKIDTDDSYKFDSVGRQISFINKDNISKIVNQGKFKYSIKADTLIKETYINNELHSTTKTINNKHFTYNNEYKLINYLENKPGKNSRIEVNVDWINKDIDSTFYCKEKVVKTTSNRADNRTVTTRKYDNKGNIIIEKTIVMPSQ